MRNPKNRIFLSALLLPVALIVFLACDTFDPTGADENNDNFLAPPANITIKISDGVIILSWTYDDTSQVKAFRIYRKEQDESTFRIIATTAKFSFRDASLSNGIVYLYQLAAVGKQDAEGEHTKTITISPGIFGIILNNGAEFTNRRTVALSLTAPQTTTLMMISNDSSFSEASWELFLRAKNWELPFADGKKTVFAKFRNASDHETEMPVRDEITLDTSANIESIEENSQGRSMQSPEVLHIRMNAGEINGTASADIVDPAKNDESGKELNIRLYDDGAHGDQAAGDGIYETDYVVRQGLEVQNAFVYGHFTDAAGNAAPRATATTKVTIQSAPAAVKLNEPTTISENITALKLTWTPNSDTDFVSYKLMRAQNATVTLTSTLAVEFNSQNTTEYSDTNLQPGTDYYYRVFVFDRAGNSTGSNVAQGRTPDNEPPPAVVLSQPVQQSNSLSLSWTPSVAPDFANYRLFRSATSPVDTSVAPIVIINTSNTTGYRDSSTQPDVEYFYRLFVFDKFGLSAGSNEVKGKVTQ
ncbi:MAG: fibronectin type III domain-containing protein [bacterium]